MTPLVVPPPDDLAPEIERRKARLDELRPLKGEALVALRHYYDAELTYTSNAIEGNTLTASETAEVIEHGITIGGKPLRDHLEAQDHYAAVGWMRDIASGGAPIGESTVTELHRRIVLRSAPDIAGVYSSFHRRILGSATVFPNPAKVPALMERFGGWLAGAEPGATAAFTAHLRLVSIHPFSDGNGRTARLMMNLLLIRAGLPPVSVRPEERRAYIQAVERAQVQEDTEPLARLLSERLIVTLDDYIDVMEEALPH